MQKNIVTLGNKKLCEVCGIFYRHVEKCKDGKFKCKKCKRKEITNKFYGFTAPVYKVSKYNMSEEERKLLVKNGKSWKQVNGDCKYMKNLKKRKNKEYWENKNKIKNEEESKNKLNKKLIEGLKNYNEKG